MPAKRKPIIITLKELRELGACDDARDEFAERFGVEAEVTRKNLLALPHYASWLACHHPEIKKFGLRYCEAANKAADGHVGLWTDRSQSQYRKACANSLADLLGLPKEKRCRRRGR